MGILVFIAPVYYRAEKKYSDESAMRVHQLANPSIQPLLGVFICTP
jgi:hypothetical protein